MPRLLWASEELGPQLHGQLEFQGSIGVATMSLQCQAKIAVGFGIVRRRAQGRSAAAGGAVQLTQGPIDFRQVGVEDGNARPQGRRLPINSTAPEWSPC